MSVRVLVTGGTFDKEYDELTGQLHFNTTHLPEMLRRGRCMLDVTVDVLMMIDSLDMKDAHRQRIVQACRDAAESRLVITHGTDTMVDTARVLEAASLGKGQRRLVTLRDVGQNLSPSAQCGPIVKPPAETSSPRWAGRQCMNR